MKNYSLGKLSILVLFFWLINIQASLAEAANKALVLNYHHLDPIICITS